MSNLYEDTNLYNVGHANTVMCSWNISALGR